MGGYEKNDNWQCPRCYSKNQKNVTSDKNKPRWAYESTICVLCKDCHHTYLYDAMGGGEGKIYIFDKNNKYCSIEEYRQLKINYELDQNLKFFTSMVKSIDEINTYFKEDEKIDTAKFLEMLQKRTPKYLKTH